MVQVVFQIQRIPKCYVVNVMHKEPSAQIVDAKKVEFNAAIADQCEMEIVPTNPPCILK